MLSNGELAGMFPRSTSDDYISPVTRPCHSVVIEERAPAATPEALPPVMVPGYGTGFALSASVRTPPSQATSSEAQGETV